MTNFKRMTIRVSGNECSVFKMKREQHGYATDMAGGKFTWFVSRIAKPVFTGTYAECQKYIEDQNGEFMTEHGIPC